MANAISNLFSVRDTTLLKRVDVGQQSARYLWCWNSAGFFLAINRVAGHNLF